MCGAIALDLLTLLFYFYAVSAKSPTRHLLILATFLCDATSVQRVATYMRRFMYVYCVCVCASLLPDAHDCCRHTHAGKRSHSALCR